MKRLDLNWGGRKDGTNFKLNPNLVKASVSDFLAQPVVAKMRTGVIVTIDNAGYAKTMWDTTDIPRGIISYGFADRLETRESANANSTADGEGLTVIKGRGEVTLTKDMFHEDVSGAKVGATLYASFVSAKPTIVKTSAQGNDQPVIGYISHIENGLITIDFNL